MSMHSPLPWHIVENGDSTSLGLDDQFGAEGGRNYDLVTVAHGDPVELRANAELIERAVNNFEPLLAAAQKYLGLLNEVITRELSDGAVGLEVEMGERAALRELLERAK